MLLGAYTIRIISHYCEKQAKNRLQEQSDWRKKITEIPGGGGGGGDFEGQAEIGLQNVIFCDFY